MRSAAAAATLRETDASSLPPAAGLSPSCLPRPVRVVTLLFLFSLLLGRDPGLNVHAHGFALP